MYTEKNFNDDLLKICRAHYVRMNLLRDLATKYISELDFINELSEQKSKESIQQVLSEVKSIRRKIELNGGKFDDDVISEAQRLRSEGKLQEAFDKILPYMQNNKNDEDANITFGWIMYNIIKQSESDLSAYVNNLKKMNDLVQFDFSLRDKNAEILLSSLLWSIRRVVKQGELPANKVFEQFCRFIGKSSAFIENRTHVIPPKNVEFSVSRLLIRDFCHSLNDVNYFTFIEIIGFDWIDESDFETSSSNKNGKVFETISLAEKLLNNYSKRLIHSEKCETNREYVMKFLHILTSVMDNHSEYEWLPYYRVQLLARIGENEQAFAEAIEFARKKSNVFWVWSLLSDLAQEEERFNCICAGLMCKSEPDKIVGLQEKAIPYLVDREMFSEAKHLLDKLIESRLSKGWRISSKLLEMKSSPWYTGNNVSLDINSLQPYADDAYKFLYSNLPFIDAFITYINYEKEIINFIFMDDNVMNRGYFYANSINKEFNWKTNSPIRVRMISDSKRDELFHVFDVEHGDEETSMKFLRRFSGVFEKVKSFGFIRCSRGEVFVNQTFVKENLLQSFSTIHGWMINNWNARKQDWEWQIISIDRIDKPIIADFEKEVIGVVDITSKGFGFIDDCFIPRELILSEGIKEYYFVKAKAQKSWDKRKEQWSWKVTEIISMRKHDIDHSWDDDQEKIPHFEEFKSKDLEDAEYLSWVEENLNEK